MYDLVSTTIQHFLDGPWRRFFTSQILLDGTIENVLSSKNSLDGTRRLFICFLDGPVRLFSSS